MPTSAMVPEYWYSQDWLEEVARTQDSDLRAHRIALTYHHCGRVLDDFIHGEESVGRRLDRAVSVERANANWFNFATWATVTISRNIANERPPQGWDLIPMPNALRRQLTPAIVRARATNDQLVGRSLAWGQRLVFASTTGAFSHFLAAQRGVSKRDRDESLRRIASLVTWDNKSGVRPDRHLSVVAGAFERYARARDCLRNPKAATEAGADPEAVARRIGARLVLYANVMITAVEQDVIDFAVRRTVDHIPDRVVQGSEWRLARLAERYLGVPRQLAALDLPFRAQSARRVINAGWARLMTDQVLVMTLPTETLRLGRDVPPLDPALPYFDEDLRDLHRNDGVNLPRDRGAMEELHSLVRSFDRSRGEGRGSAAHDWRRYDERMNWAVTLLRSRQPDPSLFWSPYSLEDERRILAGKLPNRAGDPTELEVQAPIDGSIRDLDERGRG